MSEKKIQITLRLPETMVDFVKKELALLEGVSPKTYFEAVIKMHITELFFEKRVHDFKTEYEKAIPLLLELENTDDSTDT